MEGKISSSKKTVLATIFRTQRKVNQESVDQRTGSWPYTGTYVKEETSYQFNEEINLQDGVYKDTMLKAPCKQLKIVHIEMLEEDTNSEWKNSEPALERVPESIYVENFRGKENLLNDNKNSELNKPSKEQERLNSVKKSKSYKCDCCKKFYLTPRVLKVHMQSVHEKLKPFECFNCDYSCNQKGDLARHFRSVHRKMKPFKCSNCDYSCSRKCTLDKHIKSVHEKLKPFQCSECDYSSSETGNLYKHINSVHKKLKPFKCLKCDYSFSQKGNLAKHIREVHDKLKEFKCIYCDFSYSRKDNLSDHIKSVHEKLKPFKCSDCDYSCSRKKTFSNHIKAVHKDKLSNYSSPLGVSMNNRGPESRTKKKNKSKSKGTEKLKN